MFTGIIDHVGSIVSAEKRGDLRLTIACNFPADSYRIGESIACNGACLTVIESAAYGSQSQFVTELSAETIACTAPGWDVGHKLNLERALKAGDALDGHIVTGHVDGVATVISIMQDGDSHVVEFEAPNDLARFVAAKGSVCLNGVSLTANRVNGAHFFINIIPHTWQVTGFSSLKAGSAVNMEIDIIARYVARLQDMK